MSSEYYEHVNGCINVSDEQQWLNEEIDRETNTPSDSTIAIGDKVESSLDCLKHRPGIVVDVESSWDASRFDLLYVVDAKGVEQEGYRWEWKRTGDNK